MFWYVIILMLVYAHRDNYLGLLSVGKHEYQPYYRLRQIICDPLSSNIQHLSSDNCQLCWV